MEHVLDIVMQYNEYFNQHWPEYQEVKKHLNDVANENKTHIA